MSEALVQLAGTLGYAFSSEELLKQGLTHRSVKGDNNERLEFLGDAVLSIVIAAELYKRFPEASEGDLSCLRASLVNKESLAELAQSFDLGEYLLLGQGELKSGGKQRHSILADALEAIIGVIYLDGGIEVCQARILAWYQKKLSVLTLDSLNKDAKTCLQEYLQARKMSLPSYTVMLVEGADHQQCFHVRCGVEGMEESSEGKGSSRRKAEQHAAQLLLEKIYE